MPVNRGFESHVGYLGGMEQYSWGDSKLTPPAGYNVTKDMWHDHLPGTDIVDEIEYSVRARLAPPVLTVHLFWALSIVIVTNTHALES